MFQIFWIMERITKIDDINQKYKQNIEGKTCHVYRNLSRDVLSMTFYPRSFILYL